MNSTKNPIAPKKVENLDYYIENGLYVFTAHYLKTRGFCCGNNCRHCPYTVKEKATIRSEKQ